MISAMKILIVVGARPNFMKAAPILKAISEFNAARPEWTEEIVPVLVHTGQHYDAQMSDAFFADLELPRPDVFLGVGSGSHAEQTAEVMKHFEPVLANVDPDALVVAEGVPADRVYFVGNTMIDSLHEHEARAERSGVLERFGLERGEYVLLTLHRAANVDDRECFLEILDGLSILAASHRI